MQPPTEQAATPAEFWRSGPWHIAVTDSDISGLRDRIAASGGRTLTPIADLVPGSPFRICMCADPFGVTIEIYSHPISEILAAASA